MGFEQALGGIAKGERIVVAEELLLLRIEQEFLGNFLVLVVRHDVAGGVVAEEVVHGRGHLEGTLVAVFAHPRNPLGVEDATAEDAVELFLEGADAHLFRVRRVTVVGRGCPSAQFGNGSVESALKLEIVVGIEQVVFAVVLILVDDFHGGKPISEQADFFRAGAVSAIGVPPPLEEDFREVALGFPVACVNQGQQARAVASGAGTEHAQFGQLLRRFWDVSRLHQPLLIPKPRRPDGVERFRLVECGEAFRNGRKQPHRVAKGIPEHPGNAQNDIHAGASQH